LVADLAERQIGLVTRSRSGLYVVDIDVGGEKDGMTPARNCNFRAPRWAF
jgi:hypothetical protein